MTEKEDKWFGAGHRHDQRVEPAQRGDPSDGRNGMVMTVSMRRTIVGCVNIAVLTEHVTGQGKGFDDLIELTM